MSYAVRVYETGDTSVLQLEEVKLRPPAAGEVLIRHTAIGLNFIDTYFRSGIYPPPQLPFTPGTEAAGIIDAVGEGVLDIETGDRVVCASPPLGAYSEYRLMPVSRVVKLPDYIDDRSAAAMMLKGMTAYYLLAKTFKVGKDTTILLHAAAGGVGLIACQWAKHLGAKIIGTVGSNAKADLAHSHGCDYTVLYKEENFVSRPEKIVRLSVILSSEIANAYSYVESMLNN